MPPGHMNVAMLNKKDKQRIEIVEKLEEAEYFVTTYRNDFLASGRKFEYPEFDEIWSQRVDNSRIISIYKLGRGSESVAE